jgi:tetratricopeptide (TPR) repeat protein
MNKTTHPIWLPALALIAATTLVYLNSFSGAFLFDDTYVILGNPSIAKLWPVWEAMAAPKRSPVRDRPVVNYTLALTYALGGLQPEAYHAGNLFIHLGCALLLFGVLRRTFARPVCPSPVRAASESLAFAAALLWAVHPLQTESVTYITQRCESLMGFFYFGVIYCLIRSVSSCRAPIWQTAAVVSCALGMGCKASMVTAPVVAALYDRVFLASSWKEIREKRWKLYAGFFASWLILACLLAVTPYEDIKTYTPVAYALSQPRAIVHYLRLVFFPHPLCLDYGWKASATAGEIVPAALIILALLGATVWASARRPALGFALSAFFLLLAPTSSLMPLEDILFEHRMYLPLAALLALVVIGVHLLLRRLVPANGPRRIFGAFLVCVPVVLLAISTVLRNADYASPVGMWEKVLALRPDNYRARMHLGNALLKEGNPLGAIAAYRASLVSKPDYYPSFYNLANVLSGLGRTQEAEENYRHALTIEPKAVEVLNNLGALLAGTNRAEEAMACFSRVLEIDPRDAAAAFNLGVLLMQRGRYEEARPWVERALELRPDYGPARQALEMIERKKE